MYPHICQPMAMVCWDGKYEPFETTDGIAVWASAFPRKEIK
jgi:hypothetical protein